VQDWGPFTNGAYDVLSVGYGINNKYWNWVEVSASVKNTCLLDCRVNYGHKKVLQHRARSYSFCLKNLTKDHRSIELSSKYWPRIICPSVTSIPRAGDASQSHRHPHQMKQAYNNNPPLSSDQTLKNDPSLNEPIKLYLMNFAILISRIKYLLPKLNLVNQIGASPRKQSTVGTTPSPKSQYLTRLVIMNAGNTNRGRRLNAVDLLI
jgi:hypothetical protein